MNRRHRAIRANVLATTCALVAFFALSSCATFDRNDVAVKVGDRSLGAEEAQALVGATAQQPTGDQLRATLTAWITHDVLSELGRGVYEQGIAGSPVVCLRAIPVASIDATASIMAALQSGMSFADAARQFSGNTELADSGGIVVASDGTECMAPEALVPAVASALTTTPVGQPLAADLETFSAVLLLRPYDDLSFETQAAVSAAVLPSDQLATIFADTQVYVDPRYGRWDPGSGSVVSLTS